MKSDNIQHNLEVAHQLAKRQNYSQAFEFAKKASASEKTNSAYERGEFSSFEKLLAREGAKFNIFNADFGKTAVLAANSPLLRSEKALNSNDNSVLAKQTTNAELSQINENAGFAEELEMTLVYHTEKSNLFIPGTLSDTTNEFQDGIIPLEADDPDVLDYGLLKPKNIVVSVIPFSTALREVTTPETIGMLKDGAHNDIMRTIAKRAVNGSGVSGEALGVYYYPDLLKINGSSFDAAKGYEMIRRVSNAFAPKTSRYFLLHPDMEEKLQQRSVASGGIDYIIKDGKMLNQNYVADPSVDSDLIWFGAWSTVVIVLWPREVVMNPFTGSSVVKFISRQPYDVFVRNINYLCVAENCD